jgi:hypothetical protein
MNSTNQEMANNINGRLKANENPNIPIIGAIPP